jgi:hypothetical protein
MAEVGGAADFGPAQFPPSVLLNGKFQAPSSRIAEPNSRQAAVDNAEKKPERPFRKERPAQSGTRHPMGGGF